MFKLVPNIVDGIIQAELPRCVVVGVSTPELTAPVDEDGKPKEIVRRFYITVALKGSETDPEAVVTQNLWLSGIWDHTQANAELDYWQTALTERSADVLVLEDETVSTRSLNTGQNPFWSFPARTSGDANVDTDLLALLG